MRGGPLMATWSRAFVNCTPPFKRNNNKGKKMLLANLQGVYEFDEVDVVDR